MKIKKKIIVPVIVLLILLSPPAAVFRSMAVMSVYSHSFEKNSVQRQHGFDIKIPGGLSTPESDWYPFVMTFSDSAGFQSFTKNNDLSLTIMYNFPAFSPVRGCSHLFNPYSPYLGSFYGAYAVSDSSGGKYGFLEDGSLDTASVSQVPMFDMQRLVLSDFGLKQQDMVFDWSITDTSEVSYAGSDGWTKCDAEIITNSPTHTPKAFAMSYLQYGVPSYNVKPKFAPVRMYGRVYSKYIEEYDTSVFFYIICHDKDALEKYDRDILSKSEIIPVK